MSKTLEFDNSPFLEKSDLKNLRKINLKQILKENKKILNSLFHSKIMIPSYSKGFYF